MVERGTVERWNLCSNCGNIIHIFDKLGYVIRRPSHHLFKAALEHTHTKYNYPEVFVHGLLVWLTVGSPTACIPASQRCGNQSQIVK